MNLVQLVEKAKLANYQYRIGFPIMSDIEYDELIDSIKALDPDNKYIKTIGFDIDDKDDRKSKLPIHMASMNKCKSLKELFTWPKRKSFPIDIQVIITPKLDGLSFLVDESNESSWTRGNGEFGQRSNEHYQLIQNHLINSESFQFTYGEVIMKRDTFLKKYSSDFANPRNFVAGLLNSKDITEPLKDCLYIKYGGVSDKFKYKSDLLDELNKNQDVKIDYHIDKLSNLTEDFMLNLYKKWSVDFEIDGLIVEINDISIQEKLGRETSTNNPVFARAYKANFEEVKETTILGIDWNVSKQGYLKPIVRVKPIKLDGVTVSNVTGNNALFVKAMGLSTGSTLLVKRSGMVIPLIVKVLDSKGFEIPKCCTSCQTTLEWNENNIELVCTNDECDGKIFKKIVSFFNILECKNVDEGVLAKLYDNGFDSIQKISSIKESDMMKLDGFGERKSKIVFESIQKGLREVDMPKLGHASGIFKGLGSKKLALLSHFKSKPTLDDITSIKGFAKKSAQSFIDGYDSFEKFKSTLNINVLKEVEEIKAESNELEGCVFVFTGIRSKDLESRIATLGGKISSGISKTTTHVICRDASSGSSKLEKAIDMGIKVISIDNFDNYFKL